ncbi:MAG: UDP-N-acetylmuramoyl-L-alanine--D-glutamate ligase [Candidatus Magasanikbacteria bacterium]|nr:UDP-N-acetylmuramoyl-L-alanine--D-glutamate ligase [Candidatus Magasanikbacteria bacterium]
MRYKNKKILLMGLGGFVNGSGVSAAEFLASRGADLTITDLKTKKELTKNLAVLKKYKNIKYVFGEHRAKDFVTAEWVIKNPDVPMNSPFLKIAQKRKIPIDNDITLFFREYGAANVIGVTGTRGKSTITSLIYEMARRQYPSARLGGNIGQSPLRFLPRLKKGAPIILELSSFQLHNLDTIKMSPHVAVWTNFYPDHLNKYPTLADYRKDKEKIFKYQKEEDIVVLNWDDKVLRKIDEKLSIRDFAPTISCFSLSEQIKNGAYLKDGHFVFAENGNETRVCPVSATKLLGEHNQANILAAICAARVYGIKWPAIRAAIYEFKGVPDRLEIIKKINGVTFVNDCTATSPEAAMAALKSFPAGKIILISGGNSKGSSLKELAATIAVRVRVLILVPGNANEKLRHLPDVILSEAKNLQEAIAQAFKKATPGDTILFSPGLTWLLRQNEFVRGEEFKKIVKNLKK